MCDSAVAASSLVKTFGRLRALDGLDLDVSRGEVHGFLGPNGSGKSTTIRILLGLLRPTSGTVRVLGTDPWTVDPRVRARIAYVPGDVTLWPNLSGGETIDLLGRIRGGLDPARRADLVARFDLDLSKRGRAYSKGNRQKVALVAALAADVDLLILDEPTSGLDPLMEQVFQSCVREEVGRGRTVLLSSHILAEAEALCDRVSIIRRGRIVETGTLSDLRHLSRSVVDATLAGGTAPPSDLPGVHDLRIEGTRLRCHVDNANIAEFLRRLSALEVRNLVCTPPTLEELFLRQYGDHVTEVAETG